VDAGNYPGALRAKLGVEGSVALAEVLSAERDEVLSTAAERFEHRLALESANIRGDVRGWLGEVREDIGELRTELRTEVARLHAQVAGLHAEMGSLRTEARGDSQILRLEFKADLERTRADLLKWSFLFWVAQVAATAGIVSGIVGSLR
jgi:hypothetical protein